MARLTLALLGPFQAALDGKAIAGFELDRVRALLAYLAAEPDRPHPRQALVGLLWPDWPKSSALTNLRNALANLRKAIGDREAATPLLIAGRDSLQFNRAADGWVDVQSFQTLTAPHQPPDALLEGVALYRGPFLEGFELKDSPPFEEWLLRTREQLQRRCLAALERLAGHYEQSGDLAKAVETAWKQVDLAPWEEEAHRRLMRLLARGGQRGAALAQFEACRHLLQKELGVDPAPETTALYEQIRAGQIAADPPPTTTAIPAVQPTRRSRRSRSHPPAHLADAVCRARKTARRDPRRLLDPTCRLLTLTGPGGSGKTRLAVETAARLADSFRTGSILPPWRRCIRLIDRSRRGPGAGGDLFSGRRPAPQLRDYLRGKTLLLVLDNFEHLLDGAGSLGISCRPPPTSRFGDLAHQPEPAG